MPITANNGENEHGQTNDSRHTEWFCRYRLHSRHDHNPIFYYSNGDSMSALHSFYGLSIGVSLGLLIGGVSTIGALSIFVLATYALWNA